MDKELEVSLYLQESVHYHIKINLQLFLAISYVLETNILIPYVTGDESRTYCHYNIMESLPLQKILFLKKVSCVSSLHSIHRKLERWDTNDNNKGYRVIGLRKQTSIQSTKYKPKSLFDSTQRGLCYSKHKVDLPENQIQDLIVRVKFNRRLNLGLRRWLDG